MTVDEGTRVPPVNQTLTRVVVLMRLLGWAWLIALVAVTAVGHSEANSVVLVAAALIATAGAGVMLLAVKRGFLGDIWYVVFAPTKRVRTWLSAPVQIECA
ncbi:MAG: hypothetical protein O6951_06045 [Actinobacteria bacterium]|nr:hypothetical protein [Actinomycetota bacterium]